MSKQILKDIILVFHDEAGLDVNLQEWKFLCRKAWDIDYDYIQVDRFAKIGEVRYTITNCNKTTFIECTPESIPLLSWLLFKHDLKIENKQHLEKSDELTSLQDHVKALKLIDILGKQNFHEDLK